MITKDFDMWNVLKKNIHEKEFNQYVHEREVWWCSMGLNVGSEQDGRNELFERPVLVLKKFNRHLLLILPITSKIKDNEYYVKFIHDKKTYSVITSQLKVISTKRLKDKMYTMNKDTYIIIQEALRKMI